MAGERSAFTLAETIAQDIRYALRILRKSPGFTIAAVSVLALGIGASTAMFSVLNAALFRPLPYRSPEQLAMLWTERPNENVREGRSAYWNIEQWRNLSKSFADIAFLDGASGTLTSADSAEKISIARISPNLFTLLGVQPLVGRMFSAEEAANQQRLVLISYRLWQSRFGGSREAIGGPIDLDGLRSRIVGVMPGTLPRFLGGNVDVWEPYTMVPDWEAVRRVRGAGFWSVVGRLRPNVSLDQAEAEMNAIARGLDQQLPASERGRDIRLVPLSRQITGPKARLALWMLTGAVFCVLLIAATNVASLSLARSSKREREIAIRKALGASRRRIVRQLFVENLTLAAISGLLGLFVAEAGIRLVLAVKPANLSRLNEISLNPEVLAAALALCLMTGIVVGLAPAATVKSSGQQAGRGIAGGIAGRRVRSVLVAAEFALAIILLVGAGLLIRSLWSVENVALGFRPERVLSAQLATPASIAGGRRTGFYHRVLEGIQALPGVESAGTIENFLTSNSPETVVITEAGAKTISARMRLRSDAIGGQFFKTLGTPLLKGRFFSAQDGLHSPRVAIINDVMARRLWPGRDPIGQRFKFAQNGAGWITVVGVVGDMRRQGLENEPLPQMFEPMAQDASRLATLLIRTSAADPLRMAGPVQAAVRRVEKSVPVYGVATLEHQLGDLLSERRFQTSLLVGFSLAALLIAAVGIYGLMQYSVATRTQEIGIRMAMGASTGAIFGMILREGLKLGLTGVVLGLAVALCLNSAGSSLLFGVTATDPLTFAAVSLLLIAVAMAACYFPARRAMRVEPMEALRQE